MATSDFLDAAISSLNSFTSLTIKENYRNRITSFNNPTSSDIGFNLENEIQSALKPLLVKARSTNVNKFSNIVSSLMKNASQGMPLQVTANINPIFSTIMGLVSNLILHEKRINKEDLDSFTIAISKYFIQFEKLNHANITFNQGIEKINSKLRDLQFDIRVYMQDLIIILNKNVNISSI